MIEHYGINPVIYFENVTHSMYITKDTMPIYGNYDQVITDSVSDLVLQNAVWHSTVRMCQADSVIYKTWTHLNKNVQVE